MMRSSFFHELIGAIFDRRFAAQPVDDDRPIEILCEDLLSSRGDVAGTRIGSAILTAYRVMDMAGKHAFFNYLNERMDIDPTAVVAAAQRYREDRTAEALAGLTQAAEPRRQELFRRLNQVPGATAAMVGMRRDLLGLLRGDPALRRTDLDFQHLFASWFNRGFLVLRPISWETPAHILEKVIAYEAVHAINDWDELRRRLEPPDRRCFAFFHPSMPDEPLVFVEVALTRKVPGSIQALLSEDHAPLRPADADTAVFYSISNCQAGLRGVSFGNSLIKQVVADLSSGMPWLKTFVTLSPVPGLNRWLDTGSEQPESLREARAQAEVTGEAAPLEAESETLRRLTARYLCMAKRPDGLPLDPVARFHLGNGAELHAIHASADRSAKGLALSCGVMVNYLYDPKRLERNHQDFAGDGLVAASRAVLELADHRSKNDKKGRKVHS